MRQRLLLIALVALIVRLSMILWSLSGEYFTPQSKLSQSYFNEGYAIAAGWGYVAAEPTQAYLKLNELSVRIQRGKIKAATPQSAGPRPAGLYPEALHPPGMSLLVAAMNRLSRGDARVPVMVLGALLDTAAAVILFLLVRAAWSESVATAAALTYAFFLPQAYAATAALLPDGFVSFYVIAGFACVLHGVRAHQPKSYLWFAAAGVLFGLGGYLRPDYDLFGAGLLPFLWLYFRNFWKGASAALVILVLTFATLLPWAFRNYQQFDKMIFTSSSTGGTLMDGLGEFNNPWGIGGLDSDRDKEAEEHGFRSAWTPGASHYFTQVFLRDVRAKPLAFCAAAAKRLPLALAPAYQFGFDNPLKTQSFSEQRASGTDRYQALLRNPRYFAFAYSDALIFAGISAFFLLCSVYMLWAERRRWALVALLMAPHIYTIFVHVLTHLEPRYMLPTMFTLMIGFGYSLNCVQASLFQTRLVRAQLEQP